MPRYCCSFRSSEQPYCKHFLILGSSKSFLATSMTSSVLSAFFTLCQNTNTKDSPSLGQKPQAVIFRNLANGPRWHLGQLSKSRYSCPTYSPRQQGHTIIGASSMSTATRLPA